MDSWISGDIFVWTGIVHLIDILCCCYCRCCGLLLHFIHFSFGFAHVISSNCLLTKPLSRPPRCCSCACCFVLILVCRILNFCGFCIDSWLKILFSLFVFFCCLLHYVLLLLFSPNLFYQTVVSLCFGALIYLLVLRIGILFICSMNVFVCCVIIVYIIYLPTLFNIIFTRSITMV